MTPTPGRTGFLVLAKNTLTEADARQVEEAFQTKLATLEGTDDLSDQGRIRKTSIISLGPQ